MFAENELAAWKNPVTQKKIPRKKGEISPTSCGEGVKKQGDEPQHFLPRSTLIGEMMVIYQ